jgi:hypothetical protein
VKKVNWTSRIKPERHIRSERSMAPIVDAISTNVSMASTASERNMGDDNSAADKGRKPLSCFQEDILNMMKQLVI